MFHSINASQKEEISEEMSRGAEKESKSLVLPQDWFWAPQ